MRLWRGEQAESEYMAQLEDFKAEAEAISLTIDRVEIKMHAMCLTVDKLIIQNRSQEMLWRVAAARGQAAQAETVTGDPLADHG